MVRIVLSKIAKQDLIDIVNYIKRNSVHYAALENRKIQEAIDNLIHQPELGRIVPEQDNQHLREMIFGNYRIIYELTEVKAKIEILTIHHHARLLSNNPALVDED